MEPSVAGRARVGFYHLRYLVQFTGPQHQMYVEDAALPGRSSYPVERASMRQSAVPPMDAGQLADLLVTMRIETAWRPASYETVFTDGLGGNRGFPKPWFIR